MDEICEMYQVSVHILISFVRLKVDENSHSVMPPFYEYYAVKPIYVVYVLRILLIFTV